jgi:ATP-dependent exoDNAse (exonuclease V) beta subunit
MELPMTALADEKARIRALTDLGSTLLVEAAAGTGKTALMAGRLTMLLASGVQPVNVAAITFTELAASELGMRVYRFIDELLAGRIPEAMVPVLPNGLNASQRTALLGAASKLNELTTATVHGFCQTIIHSYAVEADIDPGAQILDASRAEAAFDAVFEQWLRRRLTGPAPVGDPIVVLSEDNPRQIAATLQTLARLRRDHRTARPPPADLSGRPDIDLVDAVADFSRWIGQNPGEAKTAELVGQFETLATFFAGSFDPLPDFPRLWRLAHPPRLACMRRDTFDLVLPRRKTAWEKIAGKAAGGRLHEEATRLFDRVSECYRALLGRVATALVAILSRELDEVLSDYDAFKRDAAVLDFDDLLDRACALVRGHELVRRALGDRYRHIFVDEFQDTDPVQAEILFLIASDERPERWQDGSLRPGALFMVGDPKQAIYRFRGADIGSYGRARTAIRRKWPDNIMQITANFRSRPAILTHVNQCFEAPLNGRGQPGYVALVPTLPPNDPDTPCVAKLALDLPSEPRAGEIRDAEAAAVAGLCARLIGSLIIRNADGNMVVLTPGDIALLAPTGTELWRYERALELLGLPIASQAGKGLFRRQETQDFLALTRALADARDTLAFGALMRGPLVGLSEEEQLDIAAALPPQPDQPEDLPRFSLLTDPSLVSHPVARSTLSILRDLWRRSRQTAPMLLLSEAIERLTIRPILAARDADHRARATANIDALLELARPYAVKGLKRFAHDLNKKWKAGEPWSEGAVDAESNTIQVITMHSAKGLEWPVVIPINTATLVRPRDPFLHRPSDDTLHWVLGDVVPPDLALALQMDQESLAREQERLLYVACTRARDLLILPELSGASQNSWARMINLRHGDLPTIDLSRLGPNQPFGVAPDPPNLQSHDLFEAQRAAVNDAVTPLTWLRPSDRDLDRMPIAELVAVDLSDAPEAETPVGPGRVRGLILHKLMEEILTGEVAEEVEQLADRAQILMQELAIDSADAGAMPSKDEIAATASKTMQLPEIAALRPALIPELPIYGMLDGDIHQTALAGRADAIALEDGLASVVLDWKSDIAPTSDDIQAHAAQLRHYMAAISAGRGALVYMTSGTVHWIGGQ